LISVHHFFILIEDGEGKASHRDTVDSQVRGKTGGAPASLLAVLRQLRNAVGQQEMQTLLSKMWILSFMQRTLIFNQ
jgi:hypothetical protein